MYSQFAPSPSQTVTQPSRSKFRSHDTTQQHQDEEKTTITTIVPPNIMYDPRVVRGITTMKPVAMTTLLDETLARTCTLPRTSSPSPVTTSRAKPSSATIQATRAKQKAQLVAKGLIRPTQQTVAQMHTTIKVQKKRVEVPLHLYLEEQSQPPLTHTLDTQTDAFLAEAPTPVYIPRKTGTDVASQVETYMIFNFDEDVTAILDVVVCKTVEQALLEVREESEMSAIERHRFELQDKRNSEKYTEKQRLEEERQAYTKKEELLQQARERAAREKQLQNKISATLFSHAYLAPLHNQVLTRLTCQHYFTDHHQTAVESYLPHVVADTNHVLHAHEIARNVVDDLISTSTQSLLTHVATVTEERRKNAEIAAQLEESARLIAEEQARRRRRIALYIHSDVVEKSPVGPIHFTGESTIAQIEQKVYQWMLLNLSEPPARERLSFLWNGEPLDTSSHQAVYDVGIANMSMITMRVAPEPVEEEEKEAETTGTGTGTGTGTDGETETEDEETETETEEEV